MNNKILSFLNTTAGQLAFALVSGLSYLVLLSGIIIDASRGMWLILLYVSPLIVCGIALILVKLMKQARENENNRYILKIFWAHTLVIALAIVVLIALFV